ncbi:hypothetical protein [Rhizobium leguminosarum]|uniref:hypothetical protein n=1 Tax=Rhizobium leguminosarum TaxID=384 RepID=UPI000480A9DE|nr:hypothetical protein [Rhizobium leguminosarum]
MHIRSQIAKARRDTAELEGDRKAIIKALTGLGYTVLGKGAFAVVMIHEDAPNVVVKVSQQTSTKGFVRKRGLVDGFSYYVDWMRDSGTRSRYALKVYGHRFVNKCDGGIYISITERCFKARGKTHRAVTTAANALSGHWWDEKKPADKWAKRYLYRLTSDTGLKLDLHGANVMARANGSPVITDPLVYAY